MRDVRVGGTYIVNVPQRIPPAVRDRVPRTREEFAADMRLHLHRGRRFEITVTDVHTDTRTVDGFESVTTSEVGLPLTAEQAGALGLPESAEAYTIEGLVRDGEGTLVELPTTLAYTGLPTRWLDPLGTPTVLSDVSVAYYRYRVRRQAAGMEAALVAQEAAEMLEKQREVAGRALAAGRCPRGGSGRGRHRPCGRRRLGRDRRLGVSDDTAVRRYRTPAERGQP